ncbi:regulatory inactivation of DnaA Hda protein [Sinobacterium caligoides]|uniref:Regulatory inactivation of DnaA Hda protein n=1 Tax=Sinobacterium caligoides TaxID=933926 RepID=A0A3N2DPR6_9GAMM|nr:DnaA regulatory inactivator Hda [Sinobacterium caligoides]ROS01818.1 regulatory inactivation of DnaA Hda protein [Sinobacterium caligoides]
MQQMTLAMGLGDEPSLDNFVTGDGNRLALAAVREQVTPQGEWYLYLYGNEGTGCSHLLKAASATVNGQCAGAAIYIDLYAAIGRQPRDLLDGLEDIELVCLDNMQAVAGRDDWQEGLFHFYNRCRDGNGAKLLLAGNSTPQRLGLSLADLESRLSWGIVIQLHELADEEKLEALRLRAVERGLQLSDEVCHFVLARAPRHIVELLAVLERLDQASLQEKRKITVPFVKSVMNW